MPFYMRIVRIADYHREESKVVKHREGNEKSSEAIPFLRVIKKRKSTIGHEPRAREFYGQ